MGKNAKHCFYCDQDLKHSNLRSFHEKCKEVFYDKIEKISEQAANKTFLQAPVFRKGKAVKLRVCRRCFFEVSNKELREIENFISKEKEKKSKIGAVEGLCFGCIRRSGVA